VQQNLYYGQYNQKRTNCLSTSIDSTSIEQLKGIPLALIINEELDVLCDEAEAYARLSFEIIASDNRIAF
jgi:hypothetical protein